MNNYVDAPYSKPHDIVWVIAASLRSGRLDLYDTLVARSRLPILNKPGDE